ncbi:MAG TPA: M48 family metalloprotease [Mycobacteriales bacterium]|nr:M48 family metalloprotease [Mycobacteriales bacterium]
MGHRAAALVTLLVLGGALVVTIAVTTPWRPLAGGTAAAPEVHADFTDDEVAREVEFHRQARPWGLAGLGVSLLAGGFIALSGLGSRSVGAVDRATGGRWPVTVVVGALALSVAIRLVRLPFSARVEVARRRFGLSTQDWGSWSVDVAKGVGVTAALLVVVLLALVGVARRSPGLWWAWSAPAAALLVVVVSFAYPVVVEPVFNRFEPLGQGALRESLLDLARRDGIAVDDVLVADASRRTTALNAYVSGLGATRRIVVYDTLVEQATPAEVRLVVAHELGHVAEDDVRDGTLTGALAAATAMPLLFLMLSSTWLLGRSGVEGVGDPRSIALVAFAITAVATVAGPVEALVSRRVEARADLHSLELTGDAETFVASERRLAITNLSDLEPNPVLHALFASHPSPPERIALARAWARRAGRPVPAPLAPSR